MNNNDILRRLRHALDLKNSKVIEIIGHTGMEANLSQLDSWLMREEQSGFVELSNVLLCRFLDGLIIERRGLRSDGVIPEPRDDLPNNEILRKLRIALELRDDDMNAVFERVDFVVTKAELGSFFRRAGHRNYRACPQQVLRKFIAGLGQSAR